MSLLSVLTLWVLGGLQEMRQHNSPAFWFGIRQGPGACRSCSRPALSHLRSICYLSFKLSPTGC